MTAPQQIPTVTAIDKAQWQPHDYPLIGHFAHFAQAANAMVTEGPLAGGGYSSLSTSAHP